MARRDGPPRESLCEPQVARLAAEQATLGLLEYSNLQSVTYMYMASKLAIQKFCGLN